MTTTEEERRWWTEPGSDSVAQATYASIKAALAGLSKRRDVEIFLQGSYANHTNIKADSDVDVVVMTTETYRGEVARLGSVGQERYRNLPQATYTPLDLRTDVHNALAEYYGAANVEARNKCITVRKRPGYVDADVVPCIEYRHFEAGSNSTTQYVQGISIQTASGARIVNYPKEHIKNGQGKNLTTFQRYKPTVRQIKRLRNRAVAEGRIADGDAPGYLLECMTYNVPTGEFIADHAQRLWDIALWLHLADKSAFRSCDEIHTLFGTDPGGFSLADADVICKALWDAV